MQNIVLKYGVDYTHDIPSWVKPEKPFRSHLERARGVGTEYDVQVTDLVEIHVGHESRDWGYNPAPNGARARITGFGEIACGRVSGIERRAGVYVNNCWAKLDVLDREISMCHLRFVEPGPRNSGIPHEGYLRPLPELPVMEHDLVRVPGEINTYDPIPGHDRDVWFIERIDYDRTGPRVSITGAKRAGSLSVDVNNVQLVERGNVYKFENKEDLHFPTVTDMVAFFTSIARREEVRNPLTGNFNFTNLSVSLKALRDGLGHGLSVTPGFMGVKFLHPPHNIYRFYDERVGAIVREETLKGFNR